MHSVISASEIFNASILIADDKEANVLLLQQTLREADYVRVHSTRNPLEVCALHRKNRYDLILLDLQMPLMDGFEVMEQLKTVEEGSYLPVLVLTADPGQKLRALNAGAKDFISKPIDLAEVLVRVRNMIEVRLLHKLGTVVNVARLKNAQRIAALGDWEYDFSREHHLRWSDGIYSILGICRKDNPPNAKTFYKYVHPDDLAFVKREKHTAATGVRRVDFEHRIIRADGKVRYIRHVAEITFDDQGMPALESGTIQDVTERRNAEANLRESEERYRKMVTLSPDAQFVQVDGVITLVNDAFCRMMRADNPSQLIGKPAIDIAHPDYRELVFQRRFRHITEQSLPAFELVFERLDGTFVDVEASTMAFDFQGGTEIQVIARDISARKLVVAALRESEERFKFVARAISDVVWDWNLADGTLWWNDGFLTTFGFRVGEIEPSIDAWNARIHPDDRARVVDSINQAINGLGDGWREEYRFQRKDGTFALVHDRGFILRDATGTAFRMVGGMRDLTEQKRMEAQYLRVQRMESIGTLAGGIAHDLNNVLAPIMMAIELLKQDKGNDPRRTKILDTMHISCQRGADLVRQVLSFSRGVDHQRVVICLKHMIGDLEGVMTQTFPRNIRISVNVAENLWPVTGDPSQLHQVLLNLVVNARDSMLPGGDLTVTASNVSIDSQFAATSHGVNAGSYVLINVSDTGCGIAPEIRERIFEPFFTTKEPGKGTGLGLATVHNVVKAHGGFLNVESDMGRGSVFKVYLPADPANRVPGTENPIEIELPRGNGELILVIDDESSIREITQQTLEAFGYRVLTATDGASAVAIYAKRAHEVALVITDMMMPVMDGEATIHVLMCINPAVKIIAGSGLELTGNIAKATNAGVHDFLNKPFTARTLAERVRDVIDRPAVLAAFDA